MSVRAVVICLLLLPVGCATAPAILDQFEEVPATPVVNAPEPQPSHSADSSVVAHGKYMVELLGCGGCHTDGALVGTPDHAYAMAGSHIGIAHSNPLVNKTPAVVFPPNLTPDLETGIGHKSDLQLKASISGRIGNGLSGRHSYRTLRVMPVVAYSKVKDDDVEAIIAYLRSLPPVNNSIPRNVSEGTKTDFNYVHFGVYSRRENQ